MSEGTLESIDAVMADVHSEDYEHINQEQEEVDQSNDWNKKDIAVEDGGGGEEGAVEEDTQLDNSVREEIKAALMAGQKTITLSADDASLEAKILEIVRQSRHLEQGEGSQQQYIEIVNDDEGQVASRILGTQAEGEGETDGQRVVEIDLMNFKLVRYQDEGTEDDGSGHGLGGLVVAEHEDDQQQEYIQLSNRDEGTSDEHEAVHYIHNTNSHPTSRGGVQYVQVIEKDKVPLVYFTTEQPKSQRSLTTSSITVGKRKRGEFVLSQDAMSSPNFKLYLYNCKLCDFKCNAIKELTAHKAMHPGFGAGRYRSLAKPPSEKSLPLSDVSPLSVSNMKQYEVEHCTHCMYKTVSKTHLNKHMIKCHSTPKSKTFEGSPDPNLFDSYESDGHTLYECKKCNCKSNSIKSVMKHKCSKKSKDEEFVLS